ncbi:MAG: tungstate ABC transporter substrate-binding protein WtpA [Dehalococcoidia bacterium]|nr:tungstate ABC transporter substrate-binding protein WtpA [Dehalococcoidia bacterium]
MNTRNRWVSFVALAAILLSAFSGGGCGSSHKTTLKVINADSLMVPFTAIEKAFEERHPDVDVLIEGHGSIQAIRHVTELYHEFDVIAVADWSLLPMMMYDKPMPDTNIPYADWYVKFGTNRLGLAYKPSGKYADEINSSNWYEVISRSNVKVGTSDPQFDSCGYRALMMCQLAELYYNDDTIFEKVMGDFSPKVSVTSDNGKYTISLPATARSKRLTVRGSSIGLLATIDSGDIDYAFMYESMAQQHGLKFVELPPEIDLSSPDYADSYGKVTCSLSFQRFATVIPEFRGERILYAMTIPKNAPHPDVAAEFVAFVLSPEGCEVLSKAYQPSLIPPIVDRPENAPALVTSPS